MEWNNLLNKNVLWNNIPTTLISINDNYITLETKEGKISTFCAPTSNNLDVRQIQMIYSNHIKFEEPIQTEILKYINQRIEAIKIQKELELQVKEEEKNRLLEEGKLQRKIKNKQQYIANKKKLFEHKRNTELYPTWLVFQGKNYKKEFEDQYLFVADTFDKSMPFWDTIEELKVDDVILHCRGQFIYAISQVILVGHEWTDDQDGKGRRVDCDYIFLDNPLDLNNYRDIIIDYNQECMSPFNKHGKGNQGYLFPFDFDLAKFFIQEAVKTNAKLLQYKYVQNIIQ